MCFSKHFLFSFSFLCKFFFIIFLYTYSIFDNYILFHFIFAFLLLMLLLFNMKSEIILCLSYFAFQQWFAKAVYFKINAFLISVSVCLSSHFSFVVSYILVRLKKVINDPTWIWWVNNVKSFNRNEKNCKLQFK